MSNDTPIESSAIILGAIVGTQSVRPNRGKSEGDVATSGMTCAKSDHCREWQSHLELLVWQR